MPERKITGPHSPGTFALGAALDQSQALARLLQRLQESRARFAAVREQLPDALRDQVRPGPLDDEGWSLLVPHGAAASKLRQLLPTLEATLLAQGLQVTSIRIRVQSG
ncbi:MAG TPA: hypothetical protein VET87_04280 [Rubrivivax sp.]|jgi:hypothetical protein|nr:hypothetical protein [Rubrivivax sp.]